MSIRDILDKYGITMAELSRRYNIPYRTIQDWAAGARKAPDYVLELLSECLDFEEVKTMKEFYYKGWVCWYETYCWYAQKNNDFRTEIYAPTIKELKELINSK